MIRKRAKMPDPDLSPRQGKYRFKPGYAATVKEDSLNRYRASKSKSFELGGGTVTRSLTFFEQEANVITVINQTTGKAVKLPAIGLKVLAQLLDVSYQTLWRWYAETGQLPEPMFVTHGSGKDRNVYHVSEVRVMLEEIGKHLNNFRYYRKDHEGTRNRIYSRIEELRSNNFKEHTNGDETHGQRTIKARTIRRRYRG